MSQYGQEYVMHRWRRDYIATALYGYLAAATAIQAARVVDLPEALASRSWWFVALCTGSIALGCVVCAASRFWKDDLDGGAIEQFGLAVTLIGWWLYLYAFARLLPDEGWTGTLFVGAFLFCFGAQWLGIFRWRKRLRELAKPGGN